MPFVTGLDLGQAQDPTAMAVVETRLGPHPVTPGRLAWYYAVRALPRWPLGTRYPEVVADVAERLSGKLPGEPLVVDQTGVGRAVVDCFRLHPKCPRLIPVTITAGHRAVQEPDGWKVPKKELVAVLQVLLQTQRIAVAAGLREAETLKRELENFRVKITAAANEAFGAWREGEHDDLVLALALACWFSERLRPADAAARVGGECLAAKAPPGVFHGGVAGT